jgi:hypothetical protein
MAAGLRDETQELHLKRSPAVHGPTAPPARGQPPGPLVLVPNADALEALAGTPSTGLPACGLLAVPTRPDPTDGGERTRRIALAAAALRPHTLILCDGKDTDQAALAAQLAARGCPARLLATRASGPLSFPLANGP